MSTRAVTFEEYRALLAEVLKLRRETAQGITSASQSGGAARGSWEPVTNGDPLSPELLFDSTGAAIVGFVPLPS